jgi:2-polyprenyl-3-methyl-5-hydroxy-6-metoxy-1,4-benzoquinol methylase
MAQTMSEYDRWQNRYSVEEFVFGEAPNAFLASKKQLLPNSGRVLAIADGEGRNGVWLARQGLDVLSLDFSPTAQTKAQTLAERQGANLKFELEDVHEWTYPKSAFDVVVDIFTQFSDPEQRARKWDGMKRTLKPGGLLLLEGYTPKQLQYGTGGPKFLDHLYTRAMLEAEFGSFTKLEIVEEERLMSEGTGHSGMSAVIDLVGWK